MQFTKQIVAVGFDPGYGICGYGAVGLEDGVRWGTIETPPDKPFPLRLVELDEDVTTLLKDIRPDVVGIEEDMFLDRNTNASTVMQAYGVIRCAIARLGIPEFTFTPRDIKEGICHGRATKSEMKRAAKDFFGLAQNIKVDDSADALSAAHLAQVRYQLEFCLAD